MPCVTQRDGCMPVNHGHAPLLNCASRNFFRATAFSLAIRCMSKSKAMRCLLSLSLRALSTHGVSASTTFFSSLFFSNLLRNASSLPSPFAAHCTKTCLIAGRSSTMCDARLLA